MASRGIGTPQFPVTCGFARGCGWFTCNMAGGIHLTCVARSSKSAGTGRCLHRSLQGTLELGMFSTFWVWTIFEVNQKLESTQSGSEKRSLWGLGTAEKGRGRWRSCGSAPWILEGYSKSAKQNEPTGRITNETHKRRIQTVSWMFPEESVDFSSDLTCKLIKGWYSTPCKQLKGKNMDKTEQATKKATLFQTLPGFQTLHLKGPNCRPSRAYTPWNRGNPLKVWPWVKIPFPQ